MKKIEHLKLIQGVIGRLSSYSNTIKSWTVSLITITITVGFSINEGNQVIIALILSLIIALLFMVLDIYYYMLEKSYRNLYDRVRRLEENEIDFRMSFKDEDIGADTKYQNLKVSKFSGFKSPSIYMLYFPIIVIGIVALILI
ncbi:hypothetical protein KHQ88_01185 [Mycoplasmatota bacterium]|nr:hypothetical protein KHQ88_01185 [Mycoplasmatota bacterium]